MSAGTPSSSDTPGGHLPPLVYKLGHEELVIRRRYEVLSIVNDILVGLWFLVGSILFFSEATTYLGTWFFVIGSVELLIPAGDPVLPPGAPAARAAGAGHADRLRPRLLSDPVSDPVTRLAAGFRRGVGPAISRG
ncbi:YrhK family protein [Actinomycetospora straminea]|uniref:YrhK domain-containing protein n=1 Tax=Actinomycetospora straminea TaxID=663607 RepID=A0ABP9EB48_9PSEU